MHINIGRLENRWCITSTTRSWSWTRWFRVNPGEKSQTYTCISNSKDWLRLNFPLYIGQDMNHQVFHFECHFCVALPGKLKMLVAGILFTPKYNIVNVLCVPSMRGAATCPHSMGKFQEESFYPCPS